MSALPELYEPPAAARDVCRGYVVPAPDDPVAALAQDIAHRVVERLRPASPWLTAEEAAQYMRCPVSRIRKLTMTRDIPSHRDGRRALYHRDELDSFIYAGGATCP